MGSKQTKHEENKSENPLPLPAGVTKVEVLKHTSVPMAVPEPLLDDTHPEEDVSMFPASHPEHIPMHEFCHADHHEMLEEGEVFVDFCVKLMPHQHTLFCERRVGIYLSPPTYIYVPIHHIYITNVCVVSRKEFAERWGKYKKEKSWKWMVSWTSRGVTG